MSLNEGVSFHGGMSLSEGTRADHSMVIKMSEQKLVTLEQLREFLAATEEVGFQGYGQDEERYRHIEAVLMRFGKALQSARD